MMYIIFLNFYIFIISFVVVSKFLGDQEVTANLYCNFAYPYWEGCVICSKHL